MEPPFTGQSVWRGTTLTQNIQEHRTGRQKRPTYYHENPSGTYFGSKPRSRADQPEPESPILSLTGQ